ncbi:phosphotransferase [Kribbella sp. VKM Ac-2566]|uniref:phosphotransferase n=1 Tax=Kribbella sp. VKM Ac-2566 TaxID=2512218 RepID=UPI0010635F18|nr:phosphotransferase [Kribbella sp. VKM Ac-2566]TDW98774.1 kanamycin kinase [Kribbella sp. VKM Ac-2566]
MDLNLLQDRFGADRAEPISVGCSDATVVRLDRGPERLYYKAGQGVGVEAERLAWLSGTGFPCPRIVDQGNNWLLTTELPGRDASQPWPARDRPAVLAAIASGLRALDELTDCPFASPFPGAGTAVTHGDYAAPNVFIDPTTLRFAGVLDLSRLGAGDRYVDLALMFKSLRGTLNPQYGGPPAARRFVELYGGDPEDPRIEHYITLDDTGDYLP